MQNNDTQKAINLAILEALRNVHTVTLAKIETVKEKTIDVLPVISRVVDDQVIDLPLFIDVPPIFLQGGGSYTAYPLKKGDYCLLLVSERCFDDWYHGGDFKPPLEFRIHDYSDSFALVGINPLSSAITIPDVITQVGDGYIEGNYECKGNWEIDGNLIVTGSISATGDITAGGGTVSLLNHTHLLIEHTHPLIEHTHTYTRRDPSYHINDVNIDEETSTENE